MVALDRRRPCESTEGRREGKGEGRMKSFEDEREEKGMEDDP